MAGKLHIRNDVTFSFMNKNLTQIKDDFGSGTFQPSLIGQTQQQGFKQGLLVEIAASHAGIITRNNGFYLPDRMRKGAASFTDDYPKPVLLHHQDHEDPIGRVVRADYVDTSGS